jgi:hypothetical protein
MNLDEFIGKKCGHYNWFFVFALAAASVLVFLNAMIIDTLIVPDYVNYARCFTLALPGLVLLVAAWIGTAIRQQRMQRL